MTETNNAIYVEITRTRGSAPRDAGTAMCVTPQATLGTIGGGALELRAITTARAMICEGRNNHTETIPLGPDLGQCCGGSVSLRYGRDPQPVDSGQNLAQLSSFEQQLGPLWIWGAGHVGRALVRRIAPLGAFDITWIDTSPERFPDLAPEGITVLPALDMPRMAHHAPKSARHIIVTYSHEIDLALCSALLAHGFSWCGLIGSETKKTRFFKRLNDIGLPATRITCPIGDKTSGKHPDQIAHSTALQLLQQAQAMDDSAADQRTFAQ
ncbi:xanthine dehydrogenase accessory protein XdhC [Sulfitobacter sp.]|uniref:xanthine dehydrogenase accessory protein XdhC n=1 Tax=Sulfitobacter sp. TaxID=1903071 RepID=UPI0030027F8D